jgi:hypothetical protein
MAENTSSTPNNTFAWSDDDIEVMIQASIDYKSKKEYEGLDWESVRTKYDDISKLMAEKEVVIAKERVASKMKKLRLKYREAVDSGRRSGGGRIVTLYYELFAKLWGGSPAVESISSGTYLFI